MSSPEEIKATQAATRQAMAATRIALLTEAKRISDRVQERLGVDKTGGDHAILVTRLANKHGVSGLTAKRWLINAGFHLNENLRGRPTHQAVLLHDGLI